MAPQDSQPLAAAAVTQLPDAVDAPPSLQGALGFAVALEQVEGCMAASPAPQGAPEFWMPQVGPAEPPSYAQSAPGFGVGPQEVGPDPQGASMFAQQGALMETPMSPELPPGFWLPHQQFALAEAVPQQDFAPVMMPGSQQASPTMPDQAASMGYAAPMQLQSPDMAALQPYQGAAPSPHVHMMEMQQAQGGHMVAPPPQPLGAPPMMQQQQPPQASTFMVEQPPQPFGYPPLMQLQHPSQASPVVMDQPPQPFGYHAFIQQQTPQADPMMMPHPHLSAPPCKRQRIDQYDMTYGQHMVGYQQDVTTLNAASHEPFLQNGTPRPPPNASSTLFIEGLPDDCTTREAAHIFRRYMGFREVRLVKRVSGKQPMCFVDFATPDQAFLAMGSLQGYKFDQQDHRSPKLRMQLSHSPRVA